LLLLFGLQFSNSLTGFAFFGNDLHSNRRLPEAFSGVLKHLQRPDEIEQYRQAASYVGKDGKFQYSAKCDNWMNA
jgi:hypothetical protein